MLEGLVIVPHLGADPADASGHLGDPELVLQILEYFQALSAAIEGLIVALAASVGRSHVPQDLGKASRIPLRRKALRSPLIVVEGSAEVALAGVDLAEVVVEDALD